MIYVRRDAVTIPADVLDAAIEAQRQLELHAAEDRPAFIKANAKIWGDFKQYLSEMSYGKCWYTESPEVQSFMDVDHFRPKLKTRRSENNYDPGYEWLAFSFDNFRLSAQRSNRLSTNEDTDEVEGKANWFPLLEGSEKASWDNRCEAEEKPVLIDPTKHNDIALLEVKGTGQMGYSRYCLSSENKFRVDESIKILGLNLPRLREARLRVMRDVQQQVENLVNMIEKSMGNQDVANQFPLDSYINPLKEKSKPSEPYAAAVRSQLRNMGFGDLCIQSELAS